MPSTLVSTTAYATSALTILSLLTTTTYARAHDHSTYARMPRVKRAGAQTYQGCYSASSGLTDQGSYQYQSNSYCQPICAGQNQAVFGFSSGSDCWCGDVLPPANSKVDDSNCNTPCFGFGQDMCGGTGFYSVYLSGLETSVPNYSGSGDSSSSSSGASSSSPPSSSTTSSPASAETSAPAATTSSTSTTATPIIVTSVAPGSTVVVTEPASHQTSSASSPTPTLQQKSHTNVAGVAAGVVVGVLAIAAIAGGLFFFLRRRRNQAAEDEHKRSTQVRDFMRGGGSHEPKPPGTAYSNVSDVRLDPEAGRRNSAGSIADDQDYSRKILRVANPDDS